MRRFHGNYSATSIIRNYRAPLFLDFARRQKFIALHTSRQQVLRIVLCSFNAASWRRAIDIESIPPSRQVRYRSLISNTLEKVFSLSLLPFVGSSFCSFRRLITGNPRRRPSENTPCPVIRHFQCQSVSVPVLLENLGRALVFFVKENNTSLPFAKYWARTRPIDGNFRLFNRH